MHGQQISVSRENHVRPAIQGHLEKLVVLGVAAFAHQLNDGNKLGRACELGEKNAAFFQTDVAVELRPGEAPLRAPRPEMPR